jgi:hypothetical protein
VAVGTGRLVAVAVARRVAVLAGARVGVGVRVGIGVGVGVCVGGFVPVGLGVGVRVGAAVSVSVATASVDVRVRVDVRLGAGVGVSLTRVRVGTTIRVLVGRGDGLGVGGSVGITLWAAETVGAAAAVDVKNTSGEVAVGCAALSNAGSRGNSMIAISTTMGTRVAMKAQPKNRGLRPEVNHHQVRAIRLEPGPPAIPATGRTSKRERGW